MKKINLLASAAAILMAGAVMVGCCETSQTAGQSTTTDMSKKEPYKKKYTNADFYDAQGNFKEDVAKKAFLDMFEYYDVPFTKFMEKEIWFADFGMGDFENVGMGGIFWENDAKDGYFAHAIYLLPGQMIPEHSHVETAFPAKMETWMVEKGWCYNFSEVGEATPNAPELPASQKDVVISKNWVKQEVGDIVKLKEVGTWHFLMAGPEGAIVSEWANYHDDAGLRFSNPKSGSL